MPLTFAHPVAVLPFSRSRFPISALIVGSMTPDLEYLMHLAPHGVMGHTGIGLFLFCIPMGLITLFLLHRVWKRPFAALLNGDRHSPEKDHSKPFPFLPISRLTTLSAAILMGALTHVMWDSFTHEYGWMVQQIPALQTTVLQSELGDVKLFKILQHGSTIVGLLILAAMALANHQTIRASISPAGWRFLMLVCSTSVAVGIGIGLLKIGPVSDFQSIKGLIGISIITSTAVFLAEVTLLGMISILKPSNRTMV